MKPTRLGRSAIILFSALCLLSPSMAQGPQDEKASFEFAQRLFDDASYANAAQEFRQFIINFPTSDRLPDAMFRLGEAHFQGGEYRKAIGAFQDFIDRYSAHFEVARAMRRKAEALQQLGEYTKAGAAFQEVQVAFPGGEYAPQDLLFAGDNFHLGEDLRAAESAFRSLIDRYSRSPLVQEAAYRLGRVLLDAGRSEEALARFRSVAESSGATERKPDALLEMGNVHLNDGDLSKAEAVFSRLRRAFPKSGAAEASYLVLASWFADRGDWKRAADTYSSALKVLPRNERRQQAVLGLARAYRKLGQSDRALSRYADFLKVYTDSPFLPEARLGLGRAYADLKNYQNALDAFKRLQEGFPDAAVSVQAYGDMGDIWRMRGMPRKALGAYRAYADGVEDAGEKASAMLRIAQVYGEDLGWYDRAQETYEGLTQAAPPFAAEGRFGLARTFEKTGQLNLAVREYRTYLEEHPDGARAAQAETRIRYLREFAPPAGGIRPDDLLVFIAALPSISADPEAQFLLGSFLYRHRYYGRAADAFAAALKADSAFVHAPEATYRLGESHMKLAQKARVEGRPEEAESRRDSGLAEYRNVVSRHPESAYADDAALGLIEADVEAVSPDSTRARRALDAYRAFQETYPGSDRLDLVLLRTADACLLQGKADSSRIDDALKHYRSLRERYPQSPLRERAVYGIGVCLARQRDYVGAEKTLRDFLFEFPQSDLAGHARFQMGRILLERGYYGSAAEEFVELLTAPTSLELERSGRVLLGECYFRLGDYPRAIQVDEGLLKRGADSVLLQRLARSYRENRQYEKALQTYGAFIRNFPDAAVADSIAFYRAELLADLDRTSEAIAAFGEFVKKFPKSPLRDRAGQAVGDLLFQTEDYAKAIAAYGRIPPPARNVSVAGREVLSLFRLGRIKEAREGVKRFRKAYKNDARTYLAMFEVEEGKSYLRMGNHKKARKLFEGVIKDDSDAGSEASYYRVQALRAESRDENYLSALVAFVKNHSESPHGSEATQELADYFFEDGDYASASEYYKSALTNGLSAERKPEILWRLVKAYGNLKFYDAAVGYARQLVREFPQHALAADARIEVGTLLYNKGDYRQAIQELSPQLKRTKEDEWSLVQHYIARSYFGMGDYEAAKREFYKLLYNHQGSANWIASAHYGVADCLQEQKEYRKAIEHLEKIQDKFGPTSTFGIQAGERIRKLQDLLRADPRSPSHRQ